MLRAQTASVKFHTLHISKYTSNLSHQLTGLCFFYLYNLIAVLFTKIGDKWPSLCSESSQSTLCVETLNTYSKLSFYFFSPMLPNFLDYHLGWGVLHFYIGWSEKILLLKWPEEIREWISTSVSHNRIRFTLQGYSIITM